ncbi:winged helix-turn-helix domain-containing protein [Streptomyces yanii]|uniref:Winged helix-turn-helix domain-containing protein n=1 Tax=Streptomyces yanii TaxID=78510 RepID=A0ABV5RPM0_9ACTN
MRDPATATALAERVGVSPASAGRHATVLRNTGLVPTPRIGTAVLHGLTPLVRALLDGELRPFSAKDGPAPGRVGPCGHAWAASFY